MKDYCEHCVCRGDIVECTGTGCPVANSWVVKLLLAKVKELEDENNRYSHVDSAV